MPNDALFQPLNLGAFALQHRVVLAPLTRMRAGAGNVPTPLVAEYYGQRSSQGGLVISEATQVMQEGQGYPSTPGIHSAEQVEGWKSVTQAIHAKGGIAILQLWHVGRISHSSHQPGGQLPVAPSAIAPSTGQTFTASFEAVPFETPRALTIEEIHATIEAFRIGAENAKAAGFDGVEVHGANGYLPDQFLQDGTNQRTDEYGGSFENRSRFLLEATKAAISVFGSDRVGVRLSPFSIFNDMKDSNWKELFQYVIGELSKLNLAYLHIVEPRYSREDSPAESEVMPQTSALFKESFAGPVISSGGYLPESGAQTVAEGGADAIAYGRWFIANPDLPERIRNGIALNPYDRSTFYGGSDKGYTDYPFAVSSAVA